MYHVLARAVLVACALALPRPTLAQEIVGSQFSVADYWRGGAMTDAEGLFDYCDVSIIHRNAVTLWYILRRDDVFMFVMRFDGYQFTPGEVMEVSLTSDAFSAGKLNAQVLNETTLAILVPGVDGMITTVRPSTYLSIQIDPMRTVMIPTFGTDVALDAAKACFDKYSTPDAGSGVGAPAP
jgi:hypothetical protein